MTESLYLVIERFKQSPWKGVRIAKVSKKRPVLKRPSEQALVRLNIEFPDKILEPRVVRVEIRPEHVSQSVVTVTPQTP